jgi:hypothetical protein
VRQAPDCQNIFAQSSRRRDHPVAAPQAIVGEEVVGPPPGFADQNDTGSRAASTSLGFPLG